MVFVFGVFQKTTLGPTRYCGESFSFGEAVAGAKCRCRKLTVAGRDFACPQVSIGVQRVTAKMQHTDLVTHRCPLVSVGVHRCPQVPIGVQRVTAKVQHTDLGIGVH